MLGIDNPDNFQRLLDDSFIEDSKMEYVDDINITKTYTKNNTKPTESCIKYVSQKTVTIYKKLIQQLLDIEKYKPKM